jgi:hypothetical protein
LMKQIASNHLRLSTDPDDTTVSETCPLGSKLREKVRWIHVLSL